MKTKMEERPMFGCFVTFPSPGLTEFIAQMGFDFTCIDNEHGTMDYIVLENMIRGSQCAGVPSIIRTPANRSEYIQKALDSGANGIQIPMVNTLDEVKEAVDAAYYPPFGKRGFDFLPRACDYSLYPNKMEYMRKANEQSLVILQIETVEATENLEQLLTLEGVDVFFIGPFDLAVSMGYAHDPRHPKVIQMIERCITLIHKKGKIAGMYVSDAEQTRQAVQWGASYILTDLTQAMTQWSERYLQSVKKIEITE
ncbi:HpcH/HpaI aldolase family protein [Peribacillus sp. NPDC094092]|uniref:HpcH/HpaI aldolase family protein n=1 Tax=Peribacillus sp. NPDC094092 TaxID=3390611 RepID=UPI003D0571B0